MFMSASNGLMSLIRIKCSCQQWFDDHDDTDLSSKKRFQLLFATFFFSGELLGSTFVPELSVHVSNHMHSVSVSFTDHGPSQSQMTGARQQRNLCHFAATALVGSKVFELMIGKQQIQKQHLGMAGQGRGSAAQCSAVHCIVLYCVVLYCIVSYCAEDGITR